MSVEFVTLQKGTKEFKAHMSGRFSDSLRAIPIKSLNTEWSTNKVTFEIKSTDKIQASFFDITRKLSRGSLFSLVAAPVLFLSFAKWVEFGEFDGGVLALLLTSLFFINVGVHAIHDYKDHFSGFDRIYRSAGTRLIQEGILPAYQIKVLGLFSLACGLLMALPLVIKVGLPLFYVALVSSIILIFLLWGGASLRRAELTTLAVFLCYGPLLFYGTQMVLQITNYYNLVVVGTCAGYLAGFSLLLKHFETLFSDHHLGSPNWAGKMGFDGARRALLFMVGLTIPMVGWSSMALGSSWTSLWIWVFPGFLAYRIFRRLQKCPSPLSSSLRGLRYEGVKLHFLVLVGFGYLLWV
ncbi:MAG: prenyltransferase [Bdellovibrionales bacterium]|nr:prenyltransferase [Bdellovibrionales bacterium]